MLLAQPFLEIYRLEACATFRYRQDAYATFLRSHFGLSRIYCSILANCAGLLTM